MRLSRRHAVALGLSLLASACAPSALPADSRPPDASDSASRPPDASYADAFSDAPAPDATLQIVLFGAPDNTPAGAAVYASGTFNSWDPGDARYVLGPGPFGTRAITVGQLAAGQRVEFKLTRGAWSTVEKHDDGSDVANRVVVFDPAHPVVAVYVERWADLAAPATTRTGDVRVLPAVPMPQLATTRDVWVFLPPGYASSSTRYPVLYLFDGQNLFDARASAFGQEWRVDETLAGMFLEGRLPAMIAVGVANSAQRPCEYNVFASDPHPSCADGSAQGDRTNAFVAETLKPMIDAQFRTQPGRDATTVMGSSMGGSLTMRMAFTHTEVFARAAALSPSYQNSLAATPAMPGYVRAQRPAAPLRIYQDLGTAELIRDITDDVLVRNLDDVRDALAQTGIPADALRTQTVDGAMHNQTYWAARLPSVLAWLYP